MGDEGPKVHKVWCAVDCGIAVNPDIIRAQMEGGVEVSSLSIQLAMAQAGVGVAVLSALGASHPQARGMRFVPLRPAVRREVFLQQRRDRPLSASARVLRDALLAPLHVPEAHPSIRFVAKG